MEKPKLSIVTPISNKKRLDAEVNRLREWLTALTIVVVILLVTFTYHVWVKS